MKITRERCTCSQEACDQAAWQGLRAKLGGRVQSRLLAALLMTLALLLAACGSQTGGTAGGGGSTPGKGGSTPGAAQTSTPAPAPGTLHYTEYATPTANSQPFEITAGPDGNLWFTEAICPGGGACSSGQIGRITPAGQITEFPIPTAGNLPDNITKGADGNLWFDESPAAGGKGFIGRITPAGQITEFPLPSGIVPAWITSGPDGNLWFTEFSGKVGRFTPGGQVSEFPVSTGKGMPSEIISGPDGNLWFTILTCDFRGEGGLGCTPGQIGRITPAGQFTPFSLPTTGATSFAITAGPDGNLWFTECIFPQSRFVCQGGSKVARITPAGQITEFTAPDKGSLKEITVGPDGNLWFTSRSSMIGRCTPAGQITEYATSTLQSLPNGITAGPGGTLWFAEQQIDKIAQFTPGK